MSPRSTFTITLWMLALGLTLCPLTARGREDEKKPAREEKPGEKKKRAGKELERKEDIPLDPLLEAWMKAGAPGEPHKLLKRFEGRWEAASKFWMAPGAPPMEEKGRMTCRIILGGRFLTQEFRGKWMGMEFQGIGYFGHDNVKKKYVGFWIDSMGTGVMTSEGSLAEGGKALNMAGSYSDPVKGGTKTMRMVTTFIDEDHFRDEGFEEGPDGKEFKNMEIVYTRRRVAGDEEDDAKPSRERKEDEAGAKDRAKKEGAEN
jgi:hypothetical protein